MRARLELPPKLIPVFVGEARYRGAYGGRGSAKTRTFALMSAVRAYQDARSGKQGVILCARQFMNSLEDSSLEEIKQAIRSVPWLDAYFDMGEKYIKTRCGNVKYLFTGLERNLDSIKSKARILLCWIDEAEAVKEEAYKKLLPTVREEGSEIWVTWNPERKGSPTDKRFRMMPPAGSKIVEVNYCDNPFFPQVLDQERLNDKERLEDEDYHHVWEGGYALVGRGAFNRKWLKWAEEDCYSPEKVYEITTAGMIEREDGRFKVFEKPKPGEIYAIGCDVAEGLVDGDYSVFDVCDSKGNQVATWHGHIEPDTFGEVIERAAKWYNRAFVGVERNNHGLTTLTRLRDLRYTHLYAQENLEDRAEGDQTTRFGWLTTRKSKPFIIDGLIAMLRDRQSGIASQEHVEEMRHYTIDDKGSYNAASGAHDDRIMSYAIAQEMCRRMPKHRPQQVQTAHHAVGSTGY